MFDFVHFFPRKIRGSEILPIFQKKKKIVTVTELIKSVFRYVVNKK